MSSKHGPVVVATNVARLVQFVDLGEPSRTGASRNVCILPGPAAVELLLARLSSRQSFVALPARLAQPQPPAMSSFSKNVLPRRAHRERAQPSRRVARHGLLEKKKDYKLRARDASRKRQRVRLLKEKAAFRNPDEFYHAMARGTTDKGVVRRVRDGDGGHHVADGEVRRLVETQDRAYVRGKVMNERRRIEKGMEGLHFLDAAGTDERRRHTVFVDAEEDGGGGGGVSGFSREAHFARASAGDGGAGDANGEEFVPRTSGRAASRTRKKAGRRGYAEMEQRVERVRRLDSAMEDLVLRQNLLGKGARRKVRAGDPETGRLPVFKWSKVRKR